MGFRTHESVVDVLARSEPASARAYRAVLDAVASGRTGAGELITEGEVASVLDMSRTPVREAFLRLAAEGVLNLYPKRGVVVRAFDDREIRDLLRTRIMFETSAVRWLADQPIPDDVAKGLRERAAAQDAESDVLMFARSDRDLHEAIVNAAGNATASALFTQTGPRLLCILYQAAQRDGATRRRLVREHRRLVTVALAGDAEGYGELLEAHVRSVHDVF